jgi:hypothetical protein
VVEDAGPRWPAPVGGASAADELGIPGPDDPDLRALVESEELPEGTPAEAEEPTPEVEAAAALEAEDEEVEPGVDRDSLEPEAALWAPDRKEPAPALDEPAEASGTELPHAPAVPSWLEAAAPQERSREEGAFAGDGDRVESEAQAQLDEVSWSSPEPEPPPEERSVEGRLARIHLRGGLVSLARAELETMAGQGTLDRAALADLAEARWRSGDLLGAGEAAEAHMARGGQELMALVVAAEALTAQARTVEARRIAAQVVERAGGDLEPLFAGQPRALVWPRDGIAPDEAPAGASQGGPTVVTEGRPAAIGPGERSPSDGPAAGREDLAQRAARELAALEWSVEHGEFEGLPGRLAMVLRTEPSAAPRVAELASLAVELMGGRGGAAAELHLVRGDALAAQGRKDDAAQAFRDSAAAMAPAEAEEEPSLGDQQPADDPPQRDSSNPDQENHQ